MPVLTGTLDEVLTREWLLTNGTGGFASGTVIGCPTRRYHGLLIAARRPPLERVVCLSSILERVVIGDETVELANYEFNQGFHPHGYAWLTGFDRAVEPPRPWVQWTYGVGDARIVKRVMLEQDQPVVRVRYDVTAPNGTQVEIGLLPYFALRDFHALRRKSAGEPIEVHGNGSAFRVADRQDPASGVSVFQTADSIPLRYEPRPDWWFNFRYREEAARGQDCGEDLFTPGWLRGVGVGAFTLEVAAVVGDRSIADAKQSLSAHSAVARQKPADQPSENGLRIGELRRAADQFVVRRDVSGGRRLATVLAGYPWFGDWGRDALIALPGLLLSNERFADAREVLLTFGSAEQDGLIPNRFSDYGSGCDYNSVDASLWFIHAADAYVHATDDVETWRNSLAPVCENIVERFLAGTRFNIHAGGDRLLRCGDATTQLTWMDAKFGDTVFTPRYGMPVEINALWYHGLCILAERAADAARAEHYHSLADAARAHFVERFWNAKGDCLYDCVHDHSNDPSIRPNQIFAVSLPHSPLDRDRQRAVVDCVTRHLLTPMGLRTLAASDPAYCGRYQGDGYARDAAYHQGTVWAWPIGAYVEAYLRVNDFSDTARAHGRHCLEPLIDHLDQAGLGSISEIFDGDPPHTPRGCIAQAWSVAEVLRAAMLIQSSTPVAAV